MKIKYIIFSLIVILAAVIICFIFFSDNGGEKTAYIYSDGVLIDRINLADGIKDFKVETENGYNIISVADGKIGVIEADCPDKTCMKTGFTDSSFIPVICMPNRLEIVVKSEDTETDGVSR